jgi:hypothetical protein
MSDIPLSTCGGFRGRSGEPSNAQRCLAQTRRGTLCQLPAERNPVTGLRKRCRLHGGRSTGPRTPEGRARAAAAAFRHGRYTKLAVQKRRGFREKLRALKAELKGLINDSPM